MITLKTISTGSQDGNCHILSDGEQILILDLGASIKQIKKAINFEVSKIVGAIVTHVHQDHAKSVDDVMAMGKQVFKPYTRRDRAERVRTTCGKFTVDAFALTDAECTRFVHSNAYGDECPCYAFLIRHLDYPDWNLFYATDCQYIKWKIPKVKNILLGANYEIGKLMEDKVDKLIHVMSGHLSIDNAIDFINAQTDAERVILTHLSVTNADEELFISKVSEHTNIKSLTIAHKGMEIEM